MKELATITPKEIIYNLVHLKQLIFEVTDACNLRCKYCGYADLYEGYDERENLKFPFLHAKLIIDYLYAYWKKAFYQGIRRPVLISFYGGEPLLNMPFVQQVIAYIESLPESGILFRYGMTTNAMLLDRHMDFLVAKDFQLLISLDGDDQGQSYRVDLAGKNSFQRVYSNIQFLRERHPVYFDTNVNFNSVLHNRNNVEMIYGFIKRHLGKEPMLSPLNSSGVRKEKREEFEKTYRSLSDSIGQSSNCEILEKEMFIRGPHAALLMDYIRKYSGNVYRNYSQLLLDSDNLWYNHTGKCLPFSKKMFVTVKGKILQCEKIHHEYALGYVDDNGVTMDLEQAAMQYNGYVKKYQRQCQNCSVRCHCGQCVFLLDDTGKENAKCNAYSTKRNLEEWRSVALNYLEKYPDFYRRILQEVTIRG